MLYICLCINEWLNCKKYIEYKSDMSQHIAFDLCTNKESWERNVILNVVGITMIDGGNFKAEV